MRLQESGQMYLETIYILMKKSGAVRSLDIANYMGFSKPSVSRGVGLLKKGNYILVNKEGYITLTDTGYALAEKIYERHTALTDFLIRIGVSPAAAAADACKIEHDISDESFSAIKRYVAEKLRK